MSAPVHSFPILDGLENAGAGVSGCYLLHFDKPYKHALHYLGYADDIAARIVRHGQGNGARLIRVLIENQIGFTLVRVWPGTDRAFERTLKKRHGSACLCPICQGRKTTK